MLSNGWGSARIWSGLPATEEDIINYLIHDEKVYLMLFPVHSGTLANKKEYVFDFREDFLEEFLVQYYSVHDPPGELVLPETVSEPMEEFLSRAEGQESNGYRTSEGCKTKAP